MDNNINNNNNNDDDDNDTNIMDLDLNQDPLEIEPVNRQGLGILLDELESAHDQIEERIRRLEAVTARVRHRQTWRLIHNRPFLQIPDTTPVVPNELKSGKRDSSHLAVTVPDDNGGFFDCNICLDMAREPVLTCCGHLFCWACFFRVSYLDNGARECPVCKGEVVDSGVTPVYGNGKTASVSVSGSESVDVVVPPRPKAHRVESFRQRRVSRSATHVPVAEALRRIRMGISGEDRARMRREIGTELGGRWRIRTHQFSSVLPDSASSLYSISSALDNAERLVDDLESFVNGGFDGNNSRGVDSSGSTSRVDGEDVVTSATASSSRIRTGPRDLRRRRM